MFCPYCDAERNGFVKQVEEVYPVKGEDVAITANVCTCECCGNDIWNEELDADNLLRAFDVYRKRHGLLSAAEIREIRNRYGLSQTAFARILGFGDKTITRYENGSIQDAAQNNLIELMKDENNFRQLLEKNQDKISVQDYVSAVMRLEELRQKVVLLEYSIQPKMQYSFNQKHRLEVKYA